MMQRAVLGSLVAVALAAAPAFPVAQQIGAGDTALLFGGSDAEGGIGDWYVSNGVVEAIIDDVGIASDLTPLMPGNEPPIQSEIAFTGGTVLDLGTVGGDNDQLNQMFTVGGLSTSNFLVYDTITTPSSDTVRASGGILFPPTSVAPSPCLDVVTDYAAAGSDPFLTVTSTATNNCGVPLTFGGLLDVFIWTQRSIMPFSGGGAFPFAGRGFNHPVLDLSNPTTALELPIFMSGPGVLKPADGVVDPASGTPCGEVSYGLLGVEVQVDPDGSGPTPANPAIPVNTLFGVSSTLVSALGNGPVPGSLVPGATLRYTRRLYVGAKNDVRTVANAMWTEMAGRLAIGTGTLSGDVDAADTAAVEASIIVTRVGNCSLNTSLVCRINADCTGSGTCVDPVPTAGTGPNSATTHIRTDASGVFSGVIVPPGHYELRVLSPERDDVLVRPVVVTASTDTPAVIPALSARGTVQFSVTERSPAGPSIPAKLVFKGVTPTPDPRFGRDLIVLLGTTDVQPETFGGTQAGTSGSAAGQGNVVYTTGTGAIQIRPGTYEVYASRGLEYTVQMQQVTVPSGGTASVAFQLRRSVRTRNAVSADFHIHSGRSLDTQAALRDRVLAFASEGVEVMISTDHDKNVDYAPIIAAFGSGVSGLVTSIVGNEVTGSVPNPPSFPNSIGHINAWPVTVQADAKRDGAIEDEYVAPNFLFKRLRDAGAEVIQYNHPRAGVSGITTIGIFNNIGCNRCANAIDTACVVDTDCPALPAPRDCTCVGYQPDRPITMAPNDILIDDGVRGPGTPANPDGFDNLAFDVMEIANGARDTDVPGYRQVRRDWLSLLNQGIYRGATGVSDSHRITLEHAGWARTFVFGAGDGPTSLDPATFNQQVKAGNMVSSGGPYIEFTARAKPGKRATMGDLLPTSNGKVRLRIKVRSPAWIPVEEVRVIANGFVVATFDATTQPRVRPTPADFQVLGQTLRFRAGLSMNVTQDTYFVVEAGAKLAADPNTLPTPPPIMNIVVPGVVPLSLTNPIFVDTNGNDVFDPPGLPVMAASAAPTHLPGAWERLWSGLTRVAARWTGEVNAHEAPKGTTGVTKEDEQEAARKGEYFPLHQFTLPTEAVERARAAEIERRRALEDARRQRPAE